MNEASSAFSRSVSSLGGQVPLGEGTGARVRAYLQTAFSRAQALGVQKATLEEIFASCEIVSNHAPNIPETVGMLTYDLFSRMQKGATFINTGRGATVNEPDMIRFLSERGDVCALLDVTWPEPPVAGSPLYTLPNVFLTPHIAGSIGREVMLMGELCLDEFARYKKGEPLLYEVTLEQLARLA